MADRNDSISLPIGRFLSAKRRERGLEIPQVAARSSSFLHPMRVTSSALAEIEIKGRMPSLLQLLALTVLYKITLRDFAHLVGRRFRNADADTVPPEARGAESAPTVFVDAERGPRVADCSEVASTSELNLIHQRFAEAMEELARQCGATASAVVAQERLWIHSWGLDPAESEALTRGRLPNDRWRVCREGDEAFQLAFYWRGRPLAAGERRLIEVALVRWWAGLRTLHRRKASARREVQAVPAIVPVADQHLG